MRLPKRTRETFPLLKGDYAFSFSPPPDVRVPVRLTACLSGSGKSSFLRAGLLPRMRAAGVPAFLEDGSDGIHAFRSLILTPREMGEQLCMGFATALYRPANAARPMLFVSFIFVG